MFAFESAFIEKEAKKSRGQAGSLDDPDPRPARAVGTLCLLLDTESGVKLSSKPVLLQSEVSARKPTKFA